MLKGTGIEEMDIDSNDPFCPYDPNGTLKNSLLSLKRIPQPLPENLNGLASNHLGKMDELIIDGIQEQYLTLQQIKQNTYNWIQSAKDNIAFLAFRDQHKRLHIYLPQMTPQQPKKVNIWEIQFPEEETYSLQPASFEHSKLATVIQAQLYIFACFYGSFNFKHSPLESSHSKKGITNLFDLFNKNKHSTSANTFFKEAMESKNLYTKNTSQKILSQNNSWSQFKIIISHKSSSQTPTRYYFFSFDMPKGNIKFSHFNSIVKPKNIVFENYNQAFIKRLFNLLSLTSLPRDWPAEISLDGLMLYLVDAIKNAHVWKDLKTFESKNILGFNYDGFNLRIHRDEACGLSLKLWHLKKQLSWNIDSPNFALTAKENKHSETYRSENNQFKKTLEGWLIRLDEDLTFESRVYPEIAKYLLQNIHKWQGMTPYENISLPLKETDSKVEHFFTLFRTPKRDFLPILSVHPKGGEREYWNLQDQRPTQFLPEALQKSSVTEHDFAFFHRLFNSLSIKKLNSSEMDSRIQLRSIKQIIGFCILNPQCFTLASPMEEKNPLKNENYYARRVIKLPRSFHIIRNPDHSLMGFISLKGKFNPNYEKQKIKPYAGAFKKGKDAIRFDDPVSFSFYIDFLIKQIPRVDTQQMTIKEVKATNSLQGQHHQPLILGGTYQTSPASKHGQNEHFHIYTKRLLGSLDQVDFSNSTDSKVGQINVWERYNFMYHIAKGVQYIHDKNSVHQDLKPENILITGNHNLPTKLADFGFYASHKDPESALGYTPLYVSPDPFYKMLPEKKKPYLLSQYTFFPTFSLRCLVELTKNNSTTCQKMINEYNESTDDFEHAHQANDIYALGLIFFFILHGYTPTGKNLPNPINREDRFEENFNIIQEDPLLKSMLEPLRSQRINIHQVIGALEKRMAHIQTALKEKKRFNLMKPSAYLDDLYTDLRNKPHKRIKKQVPVPSFMDISKAQGEKDKHHQTVFLEHTRQMGQDEYKALGSQIPEGLISFEFTDSLTIVTPENGDLNQRTYAVKDTNHIISPKQKANNKGTCICM